MLEYFFIVQYADNCFSKNLKNVHVSGGIRDYANRNIVMIFIHMNKYQYE